MNIKTIVITFTICFAGMLTAKEQSSTSEKEVQFITDFYSTYIKICDESLSFMEERTVLKSKYCTVKLLAELEEKNLDYDPFLNAQDCSKEWIKSINVTAISDEEYNYEVSYNSGYNNKIISIKIGVIMQNDELKINSVSPQV